MGSYNIYYIGHLVEPFLFYVLTYNHFLIILFPVLWEIFEYSLYLISGNYSVLYLESDNSEMESLQDIILYDLGGAVAALLIGYTLLKLLVPSTSKPLWDLNLYRLKMWGHLFLFVFRSAVFNSPPSAVGWECTESVYNFIGKPICQPPGEYNAFPWGLLVIVPVNFLYIWWIFPKDRAVERNICFVFTTVIVLTALQRLIYNDVLSMWVMLAGSVVCAIYWMYIFIKNCYGEFRLSRKDFQLVNQ